MIHRWYIDNLKRNLSDGLITTASYHCKSREDDMFASITHGDFNLPSKNSSDADFVQYENLTPNIVLGWITGSLDVNAIETANSASVAAKIAAHNAKTEDTGVPW
jgi:hypothetical protein|tara:strand:+ start:2645 stop:2959 length:315 start_codon:yes stop_codon:yes gene_type:complete